MTDELTTARRTAEQAVCTFPITQSWTFEYTPASSTSPEESYLQKVEKSDFVIWLVGRETTQPVVDEITTCINAGRRLLIFKLPAASQDDRTQELLQRVSPQFKWQTVATMDELSAHITAALSDELVRALRDPAPPARRSKLIQDRQLSIARCKQTWIALGVPDDVATELSVDQSVGHVLKVSNTGLQVVVGDQGSGKTLALERLFQRLVNDALDDASRPFPLFVNARGLNDPLSDYVDRMSQGYAQPSVQGASILIDGIDEIGVTAATHLLRQACAYTDANSDVTTIVTSRMLPGLDILGNQITMPTMDDDHIIDLVNRISGRAFDTRLRYGWSASIWDAAKRPLFAVMIGSELRRNPNSALPRPSQLVDCLARGALREVGDNSEVVDKLLQTLAVKAINSGTRVGLSEVSPTLARQRLIADSRLVSEEGTAVDFTLPVFREWYAARALIEQNVSVDDILSASDRWTIPLEIVLESGSEDLGRSVMTRLAASDPGLASHLLQDAEPRWPYHEIDEPTLGTAVEVGEEIRNTMEIWRHGLGDLYSVIGPVDGNANTATLGIRLDGAYLTTSWYAGGKELPSVVELPDDFSLNNPSPDWPRWLSTQIPPTTTWSWILTKRQLSDRLDDVFRSRCLSLKSSDALHELSWTFACAAKGQSTLNSSPISIPATLDRIEELDISRFRSVDPRCAGGTFSKDEIVLVERYLLSLSGNGDLTIADPWPSADQLVASGSIWHSYSPQRLLARTSEVYAGAIRIYSELADRWFSAFGIRLRLYRLLPVSLKGILKMPPHEEREPVLTWCTRCLPQGSESTVDFSLADEWEFGDVRAYWSDEGSRLQQLRPIAGAAHSPIYSSQLLPVWESRPATELAHSWLGDELRKLGWGKF